MADQAQADQQLIDAVLDSRYEDIGRTSINVEDLKKGLSAAGWVYEPTHVKPGEQVPPELADARALWADTAPSDRTKTRARKIAEQTGAWPVSSAELTALPEGSELEELHAGDIVHVGGWRRETTVIAFDELTAIVTVVGPRGEPLAVERSDVSLLERAPENKILQPFEVGDIVSVMIDERAWEMMVTGASPDGALTLEGAAEQTFHSWAEHCTLIKKRAEATPIDDGQHLQMADVRLEIDPAAKGKTPFAIYVIDRRTNTEVQLWTKGVSIEHDGAVPVVVARIPLLAYNGDEIKMVPR